MATPQSIPQPGSQPKWEYSPEPYIIIEGVGFVRPDVGCKYASSCLDCPLPVCKEDDPNGARIWATKARALELWEQGIEPTEIGSIVGRSPRTIWRWVKDFAPTAQEPPQDPKEPKIGLPFLFIRKTPAPTANRQAKGMSGPGDTGMTRRSQGSHV